MLNQNSYVQVDRVDHVFNTRKGNFIALKEIALNIAQGEFIAPIGHSGCGKSTLLNLIAGLLLPTRGVLLCAGREIAGPGLTRVSIGI
jgi:nitrate/nitrite transport system ATP-binding protein